MSPRLMAASGDEKGQEIGRIDSFDKYERSYQRMENQSNHNDQTPTARNTIY